VPVSKHRERPDDRVQYWLRDIPKLTQLAFIRGASSHE
jgi:hypothetical protein